MNFIQPLFLWTLTGMTVPIAIHLLSRREGKVIKIGSIRHLEESNTSRFKSLKLNELWLLLARCLMIVWLALFLSGAQCTSPGQAADAKWLLVEPGMREDSNVAMLIDSLTKSGFELRLLAEDFPAYDEEDSIPQRDYWKISEDLKGKTDHEIVVLSYSNINGFNHKRPIQPSHVTWITIDIGKRDYVHAARRVGDSVVVRAGHSDASVTTYTSSYTRIPTSRSWFKHDSLTDSVMIMPDDTIAVYISDDNEFATEARVLRASLKAIETKCSARIRESRPEDADWTFWLTSEKNEVSDSNVVTIEPQPSSELIRQTGRSEWVITKRLTEETAVESHLTTELATLLLATAYVDKNDVRTMPEKMAWAQVGAASSVAGEIIPVNDLSLPLVLLFLLSWIAERAMAGRKNL